MAVPSPKAAVVATAFPLLSRGIIASKSVPRYIETDPVAPRLAVHVAEAPNKLDRECIQRSCWAEQSSELAQEGMVWEAQGERGHNDKRCYSDSLLL
jgi:hypothetical protein